MKLTRIVWDEWNLLHIARRGITRSEADEEFHSDPHFYKESYKDRPVLLGETDEGRILTLIIDSVPSEPDGTYYHFTVRPADRTERRHYGLVSGKRTK